MNGHNTRLLLWRDIEKRIVHSQRLEYVLTKIVRQSLAADFLDQLAEPVVTDSIFPSRSGIKHEWRLDEAVVSLREWGDSSAGRIVGQLLIERLVDVAGYVGSSCRTVGGVLGGLNFGFPVAESSSAST